MKKILDEIQSGKFVKDFMDEYKSGNKNFNKMREDAKGHKIEETGAKLRAMMPWIGKNKLVNQENN
jgi:ketol-acid reductoisomerase